MTKSWNAYAKKIRAFAGHVFKETSHKTRLPGTMKTTVTLTAENAAAIAKYAPIVSADPAEFLNKLVHD